MATIHQAICNLQLRWSAKNLKRVEYFSSTLLRLGPVNLMPSFFDSAGNGNLDLFHSARRSALSSPSGCRCSKIRRSVFRYIGQLKSFSTGGATILSLIQMRSSSPFLPNPSASDFLTKEWKRSDEGGSLLRRTYVNAPIQFDLGQEEGLALVPKTAEMIYGTSPLLFALALASSHPS